MQVLSEIEKHRIQIYQFPDCDSDEDEDFKQQDRELKVGAPIYDYYNIFDMSHNKWPSEIIWTV